MADIRHDPLSPSQQTSSDVLLWVGAAVVASVGVAWLVLSKPWATNDAGNARATSVESSRQIATSSPAEPQVRAGADSENWLRMANLAKDSGMLLEPEDYSAWSLYTRVLEQRPDDPAATSGLAEVADALVERGNVALEQGRLDDARRVSELILARWPEHEGATALARKLKQALAPPPPAETARAKPALAASPEKPAPKRASPTPPRRDPVAEARASFDQAMADNRLLTPADDSAKHYLAAMLEKDPQNEVAQQAQRLLFDELMSRARGAVENLDTEAANTWLDEAEGLNLDGEQVRAVRESLTNRLVAIESARPIPASDLEIVSYVPPTYPGSAMTRRLEGWVDLEFTVDLDGSTRDITVTDASDESLFRNEAIRAVGEWQFKPRVYMNRPIAQRVFTRIRFAFE
jgi:TonB family protein